MAARCAQAAEATCVTTDQRPNGVTGYARIDGTPEVLAAVLAILGLAVLGQLIVISGRRRQRDFAILKTLGLVRRQLSSITAWQVSTLAGLALVAGVPLGIATGRWAWTLFASGLGISTSATTPVSLLLVIVPAMLLAANAIAFWSGRTTARLRPGEALRAE
jgi:predicted lysophospholipase L1 biosynthesis ABC-type transport system permease subunit